MKKMTNKEFKKALDDAGVSFDVFGYEGILVKVSLQLRNQARKDREDGYPSLANDCEKWVTKIHNILEERGYFD